MKSKINSLAEYFKEYEKSINDPEKFWEGVHIWFRSHGVDYDTPIRNHPKFNH